MKQCLRQKCQKEFEPTKPKQKFCSPKCRTYYTREEGKKEKLQFPATANIERKIDELFQKLDKIAFAPATEASYDGARLPKGYVADEPLSFDRLKAEIQPQNKYDEYAAALQNAQDLSELEAVGRRIKNSGLLWKEKQNLQTLGQQIAKNKFID